MLQHTGTHCSTLSYTAFTGIQYICIRTHHIYRHTIYMCTHTCVHTQHTQLHTHTHTITHTHTQITGNRHHSVSAHTYTHAHTTYFSLEECTHMYKNAYLHTCQQQVMDGIQYLPTHGINTHVYTHIYTHINTR